ncbi:unnamed protein product [Lactuca saligna]|uniref:DBC1/CARP1 catalytically inactive NUDIX hydrolase domain-containing protein n=1 Tax=Lactuca saligna TaxID=75948 RepID=A0AA35V885_LACSI|nr:unnamed protein product [Lactuca saligna]
MYAQNSTLQETQQKEASIKTMVDDPVKSEHTRWNAKAIGGLWETTDGNDPSVDKSTLVHTALRYAKDLTGLDLKNCQHWNPFLEIHYDRVKKDGIFSHKEVTVLYVPDLSDCLPSTYAWRDQWLSHKKAIVEREHRYALKREIARGKKEGLKDKEPGTPKDLKKDAKLEKEKVPESDESASKLKEMAKDKVKEPAKHKVVDKSKVTIAEEQSVAPEQKKDEKKGKMGSKTKGIIVQSDSNEKLETEEKLKEEKVKKEKDVKGETKGKEVKDSKKDEEVTTLSNVEEKKRFEFLEAVSGIMDAHLRYLKQGYELLHQMESYINQVLTYGQQSQERSNYEQAALNERMQEYKRQIDRESSQISGQRNSSELGHGLLSRWLSSHHHHGGGGVHDEKSVAHHTFNLLTSTLKQT